MTTHDERLREILERLQELTLSWKKEAAITQAIADIKALDGGPVAVRVSIHGMFDMHLFHGLEASTPEGIVEAWREHNNTRPHPATVGGHPVDDMGALVLCSAIVIGPDDKELRRVGKMVHRDEKASVAAWLKAVNDDPDIPRLLAAQAAKDGET